MSIRDLRATFGIEMTGEDIEVLLKKEEISGQLIEIISMTEVERKMQETVIHLRRFAKSLNVQDVLAEINLDSMSDMVLFDLVTHAFAFSVKEIIINGKKAEEVIPRKITKELAIEIIDAIKYAMQTKITSAIPTRTSVIVDETGGMYS